MIKVRDLVQKESCSYRGFLNTQNLNGSKSKPFYIAIALRKLIELLTLDEMTDKKAVKEVLDQYLSSEIFVSKAEKRKDISIFVDQIVRYANWEKTSGRKPLRTLVNHSWEFEGEIIKLSADLIMENPNGNIDVIKFKRKAPEMTKGGRKIDTDPKQSIELYCLQQLGQALYPDKNVSGSIIYLQKKDDKKENFGDFDDKPGTNIVSYSFDGLDILTTKIVERMKNLIHEEGSINSSKCDETKCGNCQYSNLCLYTHVDNSTLEVVPQIKKAKKVQLTFPQKEVTRFVDGFLRVNSVAGSGKTTVLALRVIELIEKNFYSPKDFLLITFTEKGVIELREKLTYWVKEKGLNVEVNDIVITTFNGFGYEIIKKEYARLGFTAEPEILDKLERYDIVSKILDEEPEIKGLNYRYPLMDLFKAKGAIVETAEVLETIKNNGFTFPEELVEVFGINEEYAYRMFGIYMKFQKELKAQNLVQYQDQINYSINLLGIPEMTEKYGFKHIICDEFQDTDANQIYMLQQLIKYGKFISLVICGDDSQAIFSWRGGNQDNILNFHLTFPGTKDIFLKNNFRSTKQISKLANELNNLNTKKISKEIISEREGAVPQLFNMGVSEIVKHIQHKIDKGVPKYEIGVIARTKVELLEVEKALKLAGVPCLLAVTELLKDNEKVKHIIGFSKFLVDVELDLHFAEFLQITQYENFSNAIDLRIFVSTEKNKFLTEYELLDEHEKIEMIYKLLEPVTVQDRAVARLMSVCKHKEFTTINELSEFLTKIETYDSELAIEKDDNTYNSVVLTTAHASKGREFESVVGLVSKFDYNEKILDTKEEERRLLFVLITRAKEDLVLTYVKNTGFVYEVQKLLA